VFLFKCAALFAGNVDNAEEVIEDSHDCRSEKGADDIG